MRRMRFDYLDGTGISTLREVEPHYLLWAWPYWYLLSWDVHRKAVRTFRLDRLSNARVLSEIFKLRSTAEFKDSIDGIGIPL
jgi:predicted DNA-binding transcriptional regulator YafY